MLRQFNNLERLGRLYWRFFFVVRGAGGAENAQTIAA